MTTADERSVADRAPSTLGDELRWAVRRLCEGFPDEYWRGVDAAKSYPDGFVDAVTEAGYLGMLIPEEFGGLGLGIGPASIALEEINASGGNAAAVHAQMYTMGTLLRHGSEDQKRMYLPKIASGACASRRLPLPSRRPALTPRGSGPRLCARAMVTWSTARRSSPPGSSTPT
jgi:Acyl-CoA dehydrogenases